MKIIKLQFSGVVKQGRFYPDNNKWFAEFARYNDKRVCLHVEPEKKKRSNKQSAYYWGTCIEILADFLGYTANEMHDAARWELLRVRRDGKPDTVRSTSDLSTVEMEDYLSRYRQWASVYHGCYIPLPNEVVS